MAPLTGQSATPTYQQPQENAEMLQVQPEDLNLIGGTSAVVIGWTNWTNWTNWTTLIVCVAYKTRLPFPGVFVLCIKAD